MALFLYRSGDGNDGNFSRCMIRLNDDQSPFAAVAALLANEWHKGSRYRRFVMANTETEGEPEYGVSATVYEGPDGEQAFGAAWKTAEFEPYTDEEFERSPFIFAHTLRDQLDNAAWRYFRKLNAKG